MALTKADEAYVFGPRENATERKSVAQVIDAHEIATTIDPLRLPANERGEPMFRIFLYDRAFAKLTIPPTAAEQAQFMKTWASITVTKGSSGWYCQDVFDRNP